MYHLILERFEPLLAFIEQHKILKVLIIFTPIYLAEVGGVWGFLEGFTYFTGDYLKDTLGWYWWIVVYGLPALTTLITIFLNERRHNNIPMLLTTFKTKTPCRIFISYKQDAKTDEIIAHQLFSALATAGHTVEISGRVVAVGLDGAAEVKKQITNSDFIIVLLSEKSISDELVQREVEIAFDNWQESKRPQNLYITVEYANEYANGVPFPFSRFPRKQAAEWNKETDSYLLAYELLTAIENIEHKQIADSKLASSSSTPKSKKEEELPPTPSPRVDPRLSIISKTPSGAISLKSPFYVERQADQDAKSLILQEGITLRIKGSRQMGKSSLLARLYQHALDNKHIALYIDSQLFDKYQLKNLDAFLHSLATLIAHKLLPNESIDNYWETSRLGPKDKLTEFLTKQILKSSDRPLVLLLDEVDRLFGFKEYREDFFSLIRSWHNKRATDPLWERFNIVLGYSAEASMFIKDLNQSPFNVGTEIMLNDFNFSQVEKLNESYGKPITQNSDIEKIMNLLQGHPYLLIQRTMYSLVAQSLTVEDLVDMAIGENSPFKDHLQSYFWLFNEQPALSTQMKLIIQNQPCSNNALFYKLRSVGLASGTNCNNARPRCKLYAQYFERYL